MATDTGGPAFPIQHQEDRDGNVITYTHDGMTLRDYFAAKALQSLIVVVSAGQHSCVGPSQTPEGRLAIDAYLLADAMLKARQS